MEMDKLAQQTFSSCSNLTIIPFLKKKKNYLSVQLRLASSVTNGRSP